MDNVNNIDNFSNIVQQALESKNITVKELAISTEMSQSYIYDLLNGQRRWNQTTIKKVSDALKISIEYKLIS